MSFIGELKEIFNTKSKHITIRGRGVFGTTVEHVISTDSFRKTCEIAKKLRERT